MTTTPTHHPPACGETVELLPWLLNGTLEATEERAVLEHLEGCEACRRELEQTAAAWDLAEEHIPSRDLVTYALGGEVVGLAQERIEKHLSHCASCRQELALVTAEDSVLTFEPRKAARPAAVHSPRRRVLVGLAATVVAALGGTAVLQQESEAPATDIASSTPVVQNEAVADPDRLIFSDFESGSLDQWQVIQEKTVPATEL